jgi:hypothetical protein
MSADTFSLGMPAAFVLRLQTRCRAFARLNERTSRVESSKGWAVEMMRKMVYWVSGSKAGLYLSSRTYYSCKLWCFGDCD